MKKTPWFPDDVLPARRGVYECDYSDETQEAIHVYRRWDGSSWFTFGNSPKEAAAKQPISPNLAPWRGLAKKP